MLSRSKPDRATSRRLRESGHLLLAILLVVALMVIVATYEAPRLVQQMKRDREEEMIHHGTEYARAIKKFYKKFGRYPTTLEQLDNTNNIRFIRKRYKDPLTKDGKWTLLRYGDIATLLNANAPGVSAASLGSPRQGGATGVVQPTNSAFSSATSSGGFGTSNFGSNSQSSFGQQASAFSQQQAIAGQQPTSGSTFGSSSGQYPSSGFGSPTTSGTTVGPASSSGNALGSGTTPTSATSNSSQSSAANTGQGGTSGGLQQAFGGGAVVGVASTSKDPTIRIYNKKKTYNEWQFIYNPVMDQANVLLKGPYSPTTVGGSNIGTPAGQLNQPNQQQSPFGQQNSGFGNQPGGSGQQPGGSNNQQQITPGQQFPPDQNH
jgi:type II secretory pathway pseudopilin PulG